jgi:prolyl-tRNA synthetase
MADEAVTSAADKLYSQLELAGVEVLYDDRNESPGVKFNDADLLGIPFRVTISQRSLTNNSVEIKRRTEKEVELVPLEETIKRLQDLIEV